MSTHILTSNQETLSLGFGEYSCNWGAHICGLYETEQERDEIAYGFLHQGAVGNDFQLYCPTELMHEDLVQRYDCHFPGCSHHLHDPERFLVKRVSDIYFENGKFSPDAMILTLNEFYEGTQRNGKRNIRATAEMVGVTETLQRMEDLMEYECRLNLFIPGKPWVSICLYDITRLSGGLMMNVLRTHPYVISGKVVIQNPYFIQPEEWLLNFGSLDSQ